MRSVLLVTIKTLFREPLALFFTWLFPIFMLIFLTLISGNVEIGGGYYLVNKMLLIAIGIGIMPATVIAFSISIATDIENKYSKRLSYFGVKKKIIMASDILANLFLSIVGFALNIIVALFFGLKFASFGAFIMFFLQYFLTLSCYMLMGYLLAVLVKKAKTAMAVGLVIMFITYMFSGAFGNYDDLPQVIKNISVIMPLKYLTVDSYSIWIGDKLFDTNFLICVSINIAVIVLGILIASKSKQIKQIFKRRKNKDGNLQV